MPLQCITHILAHFVKHESCRAAGSSCCRGQIKIPGINQCATMTPAAPVMCITLAGEVAAAVVAVGEEAVMQKLRFGLPLLLC